MYCYRPLHLLMRMIENYTNNQYRIRVICTAKPLNQDNENLFSKQFKHLFRTVIHVPSIDKVLIKPVYNNDMITITMLLNY